MKKEEMNTKGNAQSRYVSPMAEVVDVNVQGVLCQSGGNESPFEDDWGTGGFTLQN